MFLFFFILLLALVLRLIAINQSYWLDEAIQVLESSVSLTQVWRIPADFHPPLFHYLAFFWLKVSKVEWWARLLPVSLGLFSLNFLFQEVKELKGQKTALLATLLLATSSFHIYYSQEFRPYMLSCFLATASYWLFIRLIRADKTNKRDKIFRIIVNLLGLYSLYYFPFVLVSQLVVLVIFYRQKLTIFLKELFLSLLPFLFWLPMFFRQLEIGRVWANQFSLWRESVSVPLFKALPLVFIKFWLGNISLLNKWAYGLLGLGLLGFFGFLIYKSWQKDKKNTKIILIFLVTPILMAFGGSFFVPTIAPKRLLLVLPQFFFLMALGINSLNKKYRLLVLMLVLIINLSSLGVYYLMPRFQREQWRQAIGWVEEKASSKSLVLFEFNEPFGPWLFYQKNKVSARGVFEGGRNFELNLNSWLRDKNQVFLFQYLVEMADPQKEVEKWLINHGYLLASIRDFPGVGFVYEYVK